MKPVSFWKSLCGGLLALSVSLGAACSDSEEEEAVRYPDLSVDTPALEITAGTTAEVRILAGSGSYTAQASDPAIIAVTLAEETVTVKGLLKGSAAVSIEDELSGLSAVVEVTVRPGQLALTAPEAERWFSGQKPADADRALSDSRQDGSLQTDRYQVRFGEIAATLEAETLNGQSWLFAAKTETGADQAAFFNQTLQAFLNDGAYTYHTAQYWTGEESPEIISELETFKTTYEGADLATSNLRAGFLREEAVVEVAMVDGAAALYIRPLRFRDNWKWYTENLVGQDYDRLYSDYYFSIKSAGFVPPMFQIMIFNGIDALGTEFNLTAMAAPGSPIETMEGAYSLDAADLQPYWVQMLKDPDIEAKMGAFEQTFVFLLPDGQEFQVLQTLEETIRWAESNKLTDVSYVMPIFRISDERVIIPQVDAEVGLTVTMAILPKEGTAAASRKVSMLHTK